MHKNYDAYGRTNMQTTRADMHAHMYTKYTHTCVHAHMHTHTNAHTYIHTHTHMRACTHAHAQTHTRTNAHTYTRVCMYTHARAMQTLTRKHANTHTLTQTHTNSLMRLTQAQHQERAWHALPSFLLQLHTTLALRFLSSACSLYASLSQVLRVVLSTFLWGTILLSDIFQIKNIELGNSGF